MKKLLLILLIAFSVGCTKDNSQCYNCSFGTINGYQPPNEEYCEQMPYVKKVNGNDVQTYCQPK